MASVFLASDFYEHEPFASLPYPVFWTWLEAVTWQASHQTNGQVPAVFFRYIARRTWRRRIPALLAAGLIVEADPGWYRLEKVIDGHPIWRNTIPTEPRPRISSHIRSTVYARDGFACVTCGSETSLSLDHIYPYSLGGPDTIANLQTLCKSCNSRKGARV